VLHGAAPLHDRQREDDNVPDVIVEEENILVCDGVDEADTRPGWQRSHSLLPVLDKLLQMTITGIVYHPGRLAMKNRRERHPFIQRQARGRVSVATRSQCGLAVNALQFWVVHDAGKRLFLLCAARVDLT
jgi:hypothetical protein